MNILEALASGPKIFRGEGVNEEQERFIGEMTVQVLERGRAALLCSATSQNSVADRSCILSQRCSEPARTESSASGP